VARVEIEGIPLQSVVSSNVEAIGYNDETEDLYIAFLDGSVYKYFGVDNGTWMLFVAAPSKGKFVWSTIKANGYPYQKIVQGARRVMRVGVGRRRVVSPEEVPVVGRRKKVARKKKIVPKRKGRKRIRYIPGKVKFESETGKRIEARLLRRGIRP